MYPIKFAVFLAHSIILVPISCKTRSNNREISSTKSDATLFQPLSNVQFSAPFEQIRVRKSEVGAVFKGKLTIENQEVEVEIETKGAGRKTSCELPTLKLKAFDSAGAEIKIPKLGVNRINLVTPCFRIRTDLDDPSFKPIEPEDLAWKEWLVHAMLDIMEMPGFQTQPAVIDFTDSVSGKKRKGKFFFIETPKNLGKRLQGKVEDKEAPAPEPELNLEKILKEELLMEGMIAIISGGDDWQFLKGVGSPGSLTVPINSSYNNTKLVILNDGSIRPIIHDFDLTAFVSSSPEGHLPFEEGEVIDFEEKLEDKEFRMIYSPLKRWMHSPFFSDDLRKQAIQKFKNKKQILLTTANDLDIGPRGKANIIKILTAFFEILENREKILLTPPL